MLERGRTEEGLAALTEAMSLQEANLKAKPEDTALRTDLGSTYLRLAALHWKGSRLAEGVRSSRRGIELAEETARLDPANESIVAQLGDAHLAAGRKYWSIGLIREAAEHLNRAFTLVPPTGTMRWYELGVARLYLGDVAGYRELCAQMCKTFPTDRVDVVRTCTLGPDAAPDRDEIVARAERAVEAWPSNYNVVWQADDRALALYRAGRLQDARRAAGEIDTTYEFLAAERALIEGAGGNADSARPWLRKLDKWLERVWSAALAGEDLHIPRAFHPIDQVRLQILRREAWQTIDGSPPPDDPWWHLQHGRIYARLGEPEKAEQAFQAALQARHGDLEVSLALARILGQVGRREEAVAQFTRVIDRHPDDSRPRIARARFFAERGQRSEADADFRRAAALAPDRLNRFLEAGWWTVGPYPEAIALNAAPELDPDPARPAASFGDGVELRWQPAATGAGGRVDLKALFQADHISAYALTYVEAPEVRTVQLFVGGHSRVRIWLNGQLVHQTTTARMRWSLERVPVTLRAGRNTLLAKVTHPEGLHDLHVRLGDNPIDRGEALAELGLWPQAAALYTQALAEGAPEDFEFYRRLATLSLAAGDRAGYHHTRARMLEQFGNTVVPSTAASLAWLAFLGPAPIAEAAQLGRIVELDRQQPEEERSGWFGLCTDGLAYYRSGQPDLAIARLAKPAEQDDVPALWTLLAMAHHLRGNAAEARTWLARADRWYDGVTQKTLKDKVFRLPDLPNWWRMATFQIVHSEAKALFEPRTLHDPNLASLQARARQELQRTDKDTAAYDHALMVSPDDPLLLLARATRLADLNRWQQAETDVTAAIKRQPGNPLIRGERNRIYIQLGRADELAAAYRAALEQAQDGRQTSNSPRNVIAREVAAWDVIFRRLVQERPDMTSLWIGRGRFHAQQNQWTEAAADFAQVIRAREPGIEWFEYLGVLTLSGDVAAGRDFLDWAVQSAGTPVESYTAFVLARSAGTCPELASDSTQALRWAEEAIAQLKTAWCFHARALALYRAGRYREVIDQLDEPAAAWSDAHGKAQNHLVRAMTHFRLGEVAKAQQWLSMAHELIPRSGTGLNPADWVGINLLRREADALIPTPPGPARTAGDR